MTLQLYSNNLFFNFLSTVRTGHPNSLERIKEHHPYVFANNYFQNLLIFLPIFPKNRSIITFLEFI